LDVPSTQKVLDWWHFRDFRNALIGKYWKMEVSIQLQWVLWVPETSDGLLWREEILEETKIFHGIVPTISRPQL
jgi:hypothetical protein